MSGKTQHYAIEYPTPEDTVREIPEYLRVLAQQTDATLYQISRAVAATHVVQSLIDLKAIDARPGTIGYVLAGSGDEVGVYVRTPDGWTRGKQPLRVVWLERGEAAAFSASVRQWVTAGTPYLDFELRARSALTLNPTDRHRIGSLTYTAYRPPHTVQVPVTALGQVNPIACLQITTAGEITLASDIHPTITPAQTLTASLALPTITDEAITND